MFRAQLKPRVGCRGVLWRVDPDRRIRQPQPRFQL